MITSIIRSYYKSILNNLTTIHSKLYFIRCGVRWDLQQFTFDCCECGGYAMERKDCPICLGACNSVWERDVLAVSYSLLFVIGCN